MNFIKKLFSKNMKEKSKLIGYKGFDKDFKCRDFQYETEKTYEESEAELCNKGFHFCENPLNVLDFYPAANGTRFATVEALGPVKSDETKSVTNHIKIGLELDFKAFVQAAVSFVFEKASKTKLFKKPNATSGEYAHSATSGNRAHSATSGEYAHSATSGNDAHSATSGEYAHSATSGNRANSATSGYGAHSATSGNDAIAVAVGRKAKAKASLGCFLVLAEWKEGNSFTDAKPVKVISAKVDGKKIKADTWYKSVDGKFVETDDSNE